MNDWAVLLERLAIGAFFASSGYEKTFNKEVHNNLVSLFKKLGCYNLITEWLIPIAEWLGGIAILAGFLTRYAAGGLTIILLGAICLDCWKEVVAKHPRDTFDWIAKSLYMPEALMMIILVGIAMTGAGIWSIDQVLFN